MSKVKQYKVYDLATGKLLVAGKASYCSEVLGTGRYAISEIASGKYNSRKYRVEEIESPEEESKPKTKAKPKKIAPDFDSGLRDAARKWDEFCKPIREKYGIPVYKAQKKEDDK